MVEFGAGGAINQGSETQPAPPTATVGAGGDVPDAAAGGAEAGGMTTNIVNAMNTRRKRKAKGWFCPVCRQPYTSLLRLTTAPPPAAAAPAVPTPANAAPVAAAPTADGGAVAATGDEANPANGEGAQNSGLLGSLRPGFFRSLTTGKGVAAENSGGAPPAGTSSAAARTSGAAEGEGEEMVQVNARVGDVESTGGLGRVGA
jgi:hypothetical protein